jgi:hypothetical protein
MYGCRIYTDKFLIWKKSHVQDVCKKSKFKVNEGTATNWMINDSFLKCCFLCYLDLFFFGICFSSCAVYDKLKVIAVCDLQHRIENSVSKLKCTRKNMWLSKTPSSHKEHLVQYIIYNVTYLLAVSAICHQLTMLVWARQILRMKIPRKTFNDKVKNVSKNNLLFHSSK